MCTMQNNMCKDFAVGTESALLTDWWPLYFSFAFHCSHSHPSTSVSSECSMSGSHSGSILMTTSLMRLSAVFNSYECCKGSFSTSPCRLSSTACWWPTEPLAVHVHSWHLISTKTSVLYHPQSACSCHQTFYRFAPFLSLMHLQGMIYTWTLTPHPLYLHFTYI